MSYRVCRKFTSSTFRVDGQLCKVFLEPLGEYCPGFFLWNTGFAIGKSRRQLNDWYWKRQNKRRRSIDNHMNGSCGIKAIRRGFHEVLRLRWNLSPGDVLVIDSTSAFPDKQYRAFSWWRRYHPEWTVNDDTKEFFWHRPPYADDEIWKYFYISPRTPLDPLANTQGDRYFECFGVYPRNHNMDLSNLQIVDQSGRVLTSPPYP